MIFKELDAFIAEDKFAKSGRAAEEQMAFYLKRYFGNDNDIFVLNGIRLEADGDAAQVDHLIIHSHGLTIVESKSVHGKIQIKDDGQWIRWFGANQSKGIASPLMQARLQERFFRQVLGKAANNEALFARFPIDVLVAISDDGVILWPQSGVVANVCKADQVPDKISELQKTRADAKGASLSIENRKKIASFLVGRHKPLLKKQVEVPIALNDIAKVAIVEPTAPIQMKPSIGVHTCKHCAGTNIEIRYSFSYFFYCLACEKNTPIKASCPSCGELAKLRKQKKTFYVTCGDAAHETLYFENP
ncbi:nuclease-related domain-containing protein [uncultured Deefgea sp.]|uniref:nuclease-related domain-containing protein n=1 Tax=uncultured Deefgea sp. TaxID=1304914 RepID=UPI00259368F5|nr:nuclease-related domain-containing protein [uncultured Deefgea sp.]